MQITLTQFERLQGDYDRLARMGASFELSADPRAWVRQYNVLFDACLDAGMPYDEPDHQAWAADVLAECYSRSDAVLDVEAA